MLAEVALVSEDDEDAPETLLSGQVAVTWRGDGKYFATVAPGVGGVRQLRIWAREGCEAHAAGEC